MREITAYLYMKGRIQDRKIGGGGESGEYWSGWLYETVHPW
jgi:hypothetical protein